jgi:hypothetical protein
MPHLQGERKRRLLAKKGAHQRQGDQTYPRGDWHFAQNGAV